MLTHATAEVTEDNVTVLQLDAELGVRKRLQDGALDFDGPFFSHTGMQFLSQQWQQHTLP